MLVNRFTKTLSTRAELCHDQPYRAVRCQDRGSLHECASAFRRIQLLRISLRGPESGHCVIANEEGLEPTLIVVCEAERMLGDKSVNQPHHILTTTSAVSILKRLSAYHSGRVKAIRVRE